MNVMSMQNSFKNPTKNFPKFLSYCMSPHYSQTMDMAATAILFAELPELQFHYDPVIDSLYVTTTYHFHLYFFFCCDFAVPLFSPLFDPAAPFLVIPLYMAHPAATPPVSPPASPPRQFPLSLLMVTPQRQQTHPPPRLMHLTTSTLQLIPTWRMGSFPWNPFRGALQPANCSRQCGPLLALL